jgi:uncharacterized membrane protein
MDFPLDALILATALGCGLASGALFAFSSFVMAALERLPAAQGVAAMQSINRLAPTPVFMTALFGTALACLGLAVWAVVSWGDRRAAWVLAGSVLYIVGTPGVTMVANVPRNNALEALDADSAEAAGYWPGYVREWTAWNHVRTAAGVAASALLIVALTED